MIRTIQISERNIQVDPPKIIVVPAGTATLVFEDERTTRGEISQRYLQNVGIEDLYYSEGVTKENGDPACDNIGTFHGIVAGGQQLDCSSHRRTVCVYSVAGTTVATTIRRRSN